MGHDLGCVLAGCIDSEPSTEATEAVTDYICADDGPPTELETISPLNFVKRFSAINVTRNQMIAFPGEKTLGNMEKFSHYVGNSRDYPTAFLYQCSTVGRIYTNGNRAQLQGHEASCTVEKIRAADLRVSAKKEFACEHPDCESSFDLQWQLNAHVKDAHTAWVPRACTTPGCDPTIIYETKAKYKSHAKLAHSTFKSTTCPVSDCTSKTVFTNSDGFEQHLRKAHKLKGKEKAQYFSRAALGWTPCSCPFPGCTRTKTIHKRRDHLRQHLEKDHGLDKEGMKPYLYDLGDESV